MCKYVVVGWEREKGGSLSTVRRWNWRLEGGEEEPAVSGQPGAMARSQLELPCLGPWLYSGRSQCQCPRFVLPLENLEISLVKAVTVPAPHLLLHSGKQALYFAWAAQ